MKVLIGPNNMGLEKVIEELRSQYPQIEFAHCPSRDALPEALADADVFMGWVTRDDLRAAERLRWIQSPSSGVDRFLTIPDLRNGDILLTSARGTHGACLAEHAFAMILAFTRGIREFVCQQQRHHWANRELRASMVELTGSTMGVIGLGTVGRAVAKRAHAFDMRVIAVDALPVARPGHVEWLEDLSGLPRLMKESDYIVVTVPYTAETAGMIGAELLAHAKPTAMLVGISRGGVIDEDALAVALREGRLAAGALDVVNDEPLSEGSPLWDVPNLLITPHIAGGTQFECDNILDIFRENLSRFTLGELPLRNQVDKARGF